MSARTGCFLLVFAIGCGGQIAGDLDGSAGGSDSSSSPDGIVFKKDGGAFDVSPPPPPPPPPPPCTPHTMSASSGPNGQCNVLEEWMCGPDKYAVVCSCPGGACKCAKNNQGFGGQFAGCPSCQPVGSLATVCGFPQ